MDLPPGYYRQLPKLVSGPFAGYPRVFGMAWAIVAHTDSSFDASILVSFINAYQTIQPLMIGELWAESITLQIVLIENLRRLAQQITRSRLARHEADGIADRLLGVSGRDAEPASIVFADRAAGPLSDAFAVQLVHRLRDQDSKVTPALAWAASGVIAIVLGLALQSTLGDVFSGVVLNFAKPYRPGDWIILERHAGPRS